MALSRTHYDNLRVTRDAPPEVIKAAFTALAKKYHPDRNPGNESAAREMAHINEAYAVLSDATQRGMYDQSLRTRRHTRPEARSSPPSPRSAFRVAVQMTRPWRQYIGFVVLIGALIVLGRELGLVGSQPYRATPPPEPEPYLRPATAPNGSAWPATAGYVRGYELLHDDGLSAVVIDNTRNNADVFVKLVSVDGAEAYPVRQFYVPALGSFTVGKVSAGVYDLRYRDMRTGRLSQSQPFELVETVGAVGVDASRFTMTLQKVRNTYAETYSLEEDEF